jgi:hypothetical protein
VFTDLVDFPIESKRLRWAARMVVRDLYQKPHLFMRLKLTGTLFPLRAAVPFVTVGKIHSRFVTIADDGLSACAYFDKPLPQGGRIEFGYEPDALLRFPRAYDHEQAEVLDPKLLPRSTHFLEVFFGPQ